MDKYDISGKISELLDIAVSNLNVEDMDWLIDRLINELQVNRMFCINDRVLVKDKSGKIKGRIIGVDFFENMITYIVELINKTEVRVSFYDLIAYQNK